MAFPSVRSEISNTQGTNSSSWTLDYPATIVAGDLLVVTIARDGTTGTGSISGFTSIYDQSSGASRGLVFAKIATGSESGTFTYTVGASEQGAWRVASYQDWYGTISGGIEAGGTATGTSTNPDPGSFAPSWGSGPQTRWRAQVAYDDGRHTISAYPSGWTINQNSDASNGSGGAAIAGAALDSTTSPQDPGTFTSNRSAAWVAWVVTIRPSSAQTVGMNLKASSTSLFNPTVLPGAVTVSANFISGGTTAFSPATVHHIAALLLSPTTAINAPSAIHTVQANLIFQTVLFAPASVDQEVIVDFISTISAVFTPDGVNRVIEAGFISPQTTAYDPASVDQEVVSSLLSGGTNLFTPVTQQEQLIDTLLLSGGTALFDPDLAVLVEANFIGPTGIIFTPVNIHLAIDAQFIAASTVVSDPGVGYFISAQLISATVIFSPSSYHVVEMQSIVSTTTAYDPTLNLLVETDLIGPTGLTFSPQAIHQSVAADLISNTVLHNPTVNQVGAPLTVDMILLTSGAIYSPTAIQEQFVSANAIGPTGLLLDPAAAMVVIAVGPIGGGSLFQPDLIADQIVMSQLLVSGQLFDPGIGADKMAVPPFELVLKHRFNQLRQGKSSGLFVKKRLGN